MSDERADVEIFGKSVSEVVNKIDTNIASQIESHIGEFRKVLKFAKVIFGDTVDTICEHELFNNVCVTLHIYDLLRVYRADKDELIRFINNANGKIPVTHSKDRWSYDLWDTPRNFYYDENYENCRCEACIVNFHSLSQSNRELIVCKLWLIFRIISESLLGTHDRNDIMMPVDVITKASIVYVHDKIVRYKQTDGADFNARYQKTQRLTLLAMYSALTPSDKDTFRNLRPGRCDVVEPRISEIVDCFNKSVTEKLIESMDVIVPASVLKDTYDMAYNTWGITLKKLIEKESEQSLADALMNILGVEPKFGEILYTSDHEMARTMRRRFVTFYYRNRANIIYPDGIDELSDLTRYAFVNIVTKVFANLHDENYYNGSIESILKMQDTAMSVSLSSAGLTHEELAQAKALEESMFVKNKIYIDNKICVPYKIEEKDEDDCMVCMQSISELPDTTDDLSGGDGYKLSCCQSRFHVVCLNTWYNGMYNKEKTCPVCGCKL